MHANHRNSASYRQSGSRNTMVTSDFRLKVDICPFRACAVKNVQYNRYINYIHYRNTSVVVNLLSCYGTDTTFHRT